MAILGRGGGSVDTLDITQRRPPSPARSPSPPPGGCFNISWGKRRTKTLPVPPDGRLRKVRFSEIDDAAPPVPPPPKKSALKRILKSRNKTAAGVPPAPPPPAPAKPAAPAPPTESYYPEYTTILTGKHAPAPEPNVYAAPWLKESGLVWQPPHAELMAKRHAEWAGHLTAVHYPLLPAAEEYEKIGFKWDASKGGIDTSKLADVNWTGYGPGPGQPSASTTSEASGGKKGGGGGGGKKGKGKGKGKAEAADEASQAEEPGAEEKTEEAEEEEAGE